MLVGVREVVGGCRPVPTPRSPQCRRHPLFGRDCDRGRSLGRSILSVEWRALAVAAALQAGLAARAHVGAGYAALRGIPGRAPALRLRHDARAVGLRRAAGGLLLRGRARTRGASSSRRHAREGVPPPGPVAAAVGGMVVRPAAFVLVNLGGGRPGDLRTRRSPTATDIAFALASARARSAAGCQQRCAPSCSPSPSSTTSSGRDRPIFYTASLQGVGSAFAAVPLAVFTLLVATGPVLVVRWCHSPWPRGRS